MSATRRAIERIDRTPAPPPSSQAERTARRAAFRDRFLRPDDGPRPAEPQPQPRIRPTFN